MWPFFERLKITWLMEKAYWKLRRDVGEETGLTSMALAVAVSRACFPGAIERGDDTGEHLNYLYKDTLNELNKLTPQCGPKLSRKIVEVWVDIQFEIDTQQAIQKLWGMTPQELSTRLIGYSCRSPRFP